MAGNHLEALVAEWYEFRGYFVRRNVKVGKRPAGGYECELDIVAFHPEDRHLVQAEPSLDADPWAKREERYRKKFEAGRKYIPGLFPGIPIPNYIHQVALFAFGGGDHRELAGGHVMFVKDLMAEIYNGISDLKVSSAAVPEQYPNLRTLQFAAQYWDVQVKDSAVGKRGLTSGST